MPPSTSGAFRSWRTLILLILWATWATRVEAGSVTLAWDPSPDANVAGYSVAYGTKPGHYIWFVDVANVSTYTLPSLPDGTYYFAVRAYAQDGSLSAYSNEVVATVTSTTANVPTSSTSCTTPDPFVTLGGGTCYNGGWLPPGMTPPTGSSAPAPAPAPVPQPTGTQGCPAPDPFTSLGGGTCYNGGWLPPGMAPPGGHSAPAPAPAPTPAPAPVPQPTGTQGCTTPDPFTSLGGGTCYNGGWLPPGMAVPGGAPTTTASSPTSETSPEPSTGGSTGCATPDPFVILGGGTCFKGDWLPPGSELTITGLLRVLDAAEGLWVLEAEDGTIVTSPSELSPEQLIDGATVTLSGLTLPVPPDPDGMIRIEVVLIEIQQ